MNLPETNGSKDYQNIVFTQKSQRASKHGTKKHENM